MSGENQLSAGRLPLRYGAVAGTVAYLLGYAVTYALVVLEDVTIPYRASQAETAGWVFYSLHLANTEIVGDGVLARWNMLVEATRAPATTLPAPAWYLVPFGLLSAAGFVLVWLHASADTTRATAAKTGATVTAGYLPLALAGIVVFSKSYEGFSLQVRPEPQTALLAAGLAYPILFGALGGSLAWRLTKR
jgi:hypothetical protein